MFGQYDASDNDTTSERAFDMLQELERNKSDEIKRQRSHERLIIKTKVIIQPGNASDMMRFKVQGVTSDISSGGTQVLTPMPLRVGDIYRISFNQTDLDLPMTFTRCLRCRLIREDAFEVGFSFFCNLDLLVAHAATQTARS